VVIAAVAFCAAAYAEVFLEIAARYRAGITAGFSVGDPHLVHYIRLILMWAGATVAGLLLCKFHMPVLRFVYRYRYILALVILVAGVLLEISGSSIACMGKYIGSDTTGTVFGMPRDIRSDEFATFTPFIFSQQYNASGAYPYFSETIRGAVTDTAIVYALPSWDIVTIFRPFLWGYLILGPAKGLSFFWIARLLALFLVSFEFAMVYTKKDYWLSLAAAFLISLAPIVQWWFAINGIAEMLICGQAALLCVHHYMRTEKTWKRALASLLFFWCGGVYILTFYPAWEIPLLYAFAALFIGVVLENRKGFVFSWKKDIPIIAAGAVLLAAGLLYVLNKSADTIQTVMNTVYPGKRVVTGGGEWTGLFKYGASLFLPLKSVGLIVNPCETSAFFDLFPLGVLLALYVIFFEKKRDRILIPLLAAQAVLFAYCIFGFPEAVARITFLSMSAPHRVLLTVGLINVLLLVRSMAVAERKVRLGIAAAISVVLAVGVSLLCRRATGAYMGKTLTAALALVLFAGFLLALMARSAGWKKLFASWCVLIVAFSGGLVNPVQRGIDVIYQNELVQSIQSVAEQDSGLWIVEGGYPLTNVPIMAGAPTINSTNVYPNLERWRLLDKDGRHEKAYNRYAHITVDLTDEETRFELLNPDQFQLMLNYENLRTLDVKYVLSAKDYSALDNPYVKFVARAYAKGYYIYELSYPE